MTAPGLVLSPTAQVGTGVVFGAHVVVHDGVVLEDGVVVQDGAVLGKRPKPSRFLVADAAAEGVVVGAGSFVGAHAVVCAGVRLGPGAVVGDAAFVREHTTVGAESVVGCQVVVEPAVRIGDRVTLQSSVHVTAASVLEDDVFVGPRVVTTNDNTMGRHGPDHELRGPVLRRACRVGGGAVLVPGIEIGEEAFVAAGSVVTNDVPSRAFVMGVPARRVRQVPEDALLERWR